MISPCVNQCRLDNGLKICLGCKRTLEEIASWTRMTDNQRAKLILALRHR